MIPPKEKNSGHQLEFSKSCSDVRFRAVEIANTNNSNIGALHLLWGIRKLMVNEGRVRILRLNETDSARLEADLLQYTSEDFDDKRSTKQPVLTQSAKNALTIAIECAKQAGATEVTPSHLLIGIIRHVESLKQQH